MKQNVLDFKAVDEQMCVLTLSARPPFQNFSTPCILNVNNTGAKQGSIMK
jgi:hypothetical protein